MAKVEIVGPDQSRPPDEDEVIVFLLWHLGDALNATSLLPDLMARHGRKLTFVTTAACVPVLAHHPALARIRVVDRRFPERMTIPLWHELQRSHESLFPGAARVYNLHIPVVLHRMPHHIIERWGEAIGFPKPWTERKAVYHQDPSASYERRPNAYCVLGNGGSNRNKHWPQKRWRELVDSLRRHHPGLDLIQLGIQSDPVIEGTLDLRGTSVDESHHVLRDALGCLTNDSFLAHLAASSRCPTLVLFGPTCPAQFRPLASTTIPLGGHGYRTPCTRNICRFRSDRSPCLAFPSTRTVLAALERVLAEDRKPT
jgi:ADP-heptose:LPS heptosyltransferase